MQVDVVIIGGNITGSVAALVLEKLGLSVAIIERTPPSTMSYSAEQSYGIRVSSIIPVVKNFLQQLGVWEKLLPERIQSIRSMQVWESDLQHSLKFGENTIQHSPVAWTIENNHIQNICWQLLNDTSCEKIIGQWQKIDRLTDSTGNCSGYELKIVEKEDASEHTRILRTKLLIAADGAKSSVRKWSGILSHTKPYQQHCIVGNVRTKQAHQQIAWQRYHKGLAFAFLPLANEYCSIAWYVSEKESKEILSETVVRQKQLMFEASGGMLGGIEEIQELAAFPIIRSDAAKIYNENVVLIGDAIRTIHPMAGQGVNLGLCDVAVLSNILQDALQHNISIDEPLLLKKYARRRSEYKLLQFGMDSIHTFFNSSIIADFRPTLLQKLDALSIGKQWLTEVAMGLHSDVPISLKKI